jgi:hypothetical protein
VRNDSGSQQRLDERLARAVAAGHLRLVHPDFAVVDPQSRQRRHDVLDHVHPHAADGERRAARDFDAVLHASGDAQRGFEIAADKHDPGVGRSGEEFDAHVVPAPVSETGHAGGGTDRLLMS